MNDADRQLQQLLKIGTARAGRPPAGLAGPLAALLPADAAPPEAVLWLSLGALDLWERSGFVAPDRPTPAPAQAAAPETLRACPPRAQAVLALLLRGLHPAGLEAEWLRQLLSRKPRKLAAVALANKMARIAWAVMTRGEAYRSPAAA